MSFLLKNSSNSLLYTFNNTFKRVTGDDIIVRAKSKGKSWGQGGLFVGDGMLDSKSISLEGYIAEGNLAATDAEMHSLVSLLYPENLRLYRPNDDYYLPLRKLQKILKKPIEGQFHEAWKLLITWLISDPFWYSPTESSDAENILPAAPRTWDINVPAPVNWELSPRIEILTVSDMSAGFTLTNNNNGQSFQYVDPDFNGGGGGDTLEIDCGAGTVEMNGTNSIDHFTGTFLRMEPGINSITLSAGGPLTTVTFYWYPRFV